LVNKIDENAFVTIDDKREVLRGHGHVAKYHPVPFLTQIKTYFLQTWYAIFGSLVEEGLA